MYTVHFEDMPLVEFMFPVFTLTARWSYCGRFRLPNCSSSCDYSLCLLIHIAAHRGKFFSLQFPRAIIPNFYSN